MDVGYDGNIAPTQVNGVPFALQESIKRITGTRTGERIMQPLFGIDLSLLLDSGLDLSSIQTIIDTSFEQLQHGELTGITLTQLGNSVEVTINVARES